MAVFLWSSWSFFQVRDTDTVTIMGKAGLEVRKLSNSIEHAEVQGEETAKVEHTASTLRNGHLQVENTGNR